MFTTDDGLPSNLIETVLATHDGALWTGANCGGISRFDGTHFQTFNEKNGLLNSCVFALAEDTNGDLWIGTWNGGAFRYHDGTFTQYSKAQGMVDDRVISIIVAHDGTIWFGTRGGLSRLRNGEFRNFTKEDGLSGTINRIFEDRAGVIWIGTRWGLDRLVGDRIENVASAPKALIYPVGQDREDGVYATADAETVMFRFDKDRIDAIKELIAPYDMLETEQGELWFAGCNITRVPAGSFAQSRRRDEPLDYEAFSMNDGLATIEVTEGGRSLALTRDGKLWAATSKGLAMFDLRRLPSANLKPTVYLTNVIIGRNAQRPGQDLVLPPGTSHMQIDFSAVEISSPEKIRLQYRLDGIDSEWLDAGSDLRAIYSTLPPGNHALHIRACNRNGIWDRRGVVFSVTQQPFFYQTRLFAASMVGLGILLVGVIYRLRVRQISQVISARFDERMAERIRVARELHDTLLQTVQGSKLVADHALKDTADHPRMVRAVEQLSTWMEQAAEEGRAALNSLRASTAEKNNLAEAFRRAIDECRSGSPIETSFSVKGIFREMHPIVRNEIYRIGYEAIRNACAHSGGERMEVTLEYAHDLTLRIIDNGVGIDSEVVEKGKEGHFGLPGMRERAGGIGSTFTLISSPGAGSVITLVVPGRIIFQNAYLERLKSLFRSQLNPLTQVSRHEKCKKD
jgi:signal transduction histidine kinase